MPDLKPKIVLGIRHAALLTNRPKGKRTNSPGSRPRPALSRRSELAGVPLYVTILIALIAGVTEELLFRGYPIERLSEISGSTTIGACAAYVIFVGLHAPFWDAEWGQI